MLFCTSISFSCSFRILFLLHLIADLTLFFSASLLQSSGLMVYFGAGFAFVVLPCLRFFAWKGLSVELDFGDDCGEVTVTGGLAGGSEGGGVGGRHGGAAVNGRSTLTISLDSKHT